MSCTIDWNTLSPAAWQERYALIPRSNILQAYEYAQGICPLKRLKGRWGLIRIDGQEAGMVQILEAGVFGNALHAITIDRGPLWFDGFGTPPHFEMFMQALLKKWPRRIGRKYRIIPEVEESPALQKAMREHGFKVSGDSPYKTIWLELDKSEEELLASLKKNWRNMISKAAKNDVTVTWEMTTDSYRAFLKNYTIDKAAKGYDGASVELITALTKTFLPARKMILGSVLNKDGQVLASVLHFLHGRSATYQIGWNSDDGRKIGAHNYLLWHSLPILKDHGIKELDLGGYNDEDAKGVRDFKDGMGGVAVRLSRIYTG